MSRLKRSLNYRLLGLFIWLGLHESLGLIKTDPGLQLDPVIALLPWTAWEKPSQQVRYTIKAYGGCFEWTSQRPDLINVEAVYRSDAMDGVSCSTEATVTQISLHPIEDKAWIFARNKATQMELRCEIHVAPLASIVIDTPTKSIGVEAVETLSLRGFDSSGNVFSSLEGMRFKWRSSNPDVLSFASLDADVYRASSTRQKVQKSGGQSDIVLLKGISSGRSQVTVSTDSKVYSSVADASVYLEVSEPLFVEPPFLRVPPYAQVQFGLRILKQQSGASESPLVPLPSKNFKWHSESQTVTTSGLIHVSPDTARIFINSTQSSLNRVIVVDQRTANNTGSAVVIVTFMKRLQLFSFDAASLVVEQEGHFTREYSKTLDDWETKLHFPFAVPQVKPLLTKAENLLHYGQKHWILVRGRDYYLGGVGFDEKDQEVYIPRNFRFQLYCQSGTEKNSLSMTPVKGKETTYKAKCECIQPIWISSTQRFLGFKAVEVGSGKLESVIEKPERPDSANFPKGLDSLLPLRHAISFVVVDPVRVKGRPAAKQEKINHATFPPAVLPVLHEWTFSAFGGTGSYIWSSSNASVISISPTVGKQQSDVIVKALCYGIAELKVRDGETPSNMYSFNIIVAPLQRLIIDSNRIQTRVNEDLHIYVRAFPNFSGIQWREDWPSLHTLSSYLSLLHQQGTQNFANVGSGVLAFERSMTVDQAKMFMNFHFLNCTGEVVNDSWNLSTSNKSHIDLFNSISASVYGQRGERLIKQRYFKALIPYVCGVLEVTPDTPGIISVKASTVTKFSGSSSDALEGEIALPHLEATSLIQVYSDLKFVLPVSTPWIPSHQQPIPSFSERNSTTFIVAVGILMDLRTQGGPSKVGMIEVEETLSYTKSDPLGAVTAESSSKGMSLICLKDNVTIVAQVTRRVIASNKELMLYKRDHYGKIIIDSDEETQIIPYFTETAVAVTDVQIICAIPSFIEIHAEPNEKNLDVVRAESKVVNAVHVNEVLASEKQKRDSYKLATGFVRCGRSHRFGVFLYSSSKMLVNYWNGYDVEWKIASDSGQSHLSGVNVFERSINISNSGCYGEDLLSASLKLDLVSLKKNVMEGPLKKNKNGLKLFLAEMKTFDLKLKETILPRWYHTTVKDDFLLSDIVRLYPVPGQRLIPTRNVYFYHPDWIRRFLVLYGSGQYSISIGTPLDMYDGTNQNDVSTQSILLATIETHYRVALPPVALSPHMTWFQMLSRLPRWSKGFLRSDTIAPIHSGADPKLLGCIDYVGNTSIMTQDPETEIIMNAPFTNQNPQSYWDVAFRSTTLVKRALVRIRDEGLLGGQEVNRVISFSTISKVHISLGIQFFQYNNAGSQLQEMSLINEKPLDQYSLEQYSIFTVALGIFDKDGDDFSPDDYRMMRLCLTVVAGPLRGMRTTCKKSAPDETQDFTDVENQATDADLPSEVSQFWENVQKHPSVSASASLFQGLTAGIYELRVEAYNYLDAKVTSNSLFVEIFEALSVSPTSLVLMPGGYTHELSLKGGPRSDDCLLHSCLRFLHANSIEGASFSDFTARESKFISMGLEDVSLPSIKTKDLLGSTLIKIETGGHKSMLRSSVDVSVVVDVPTRVEILLTKKTLRSLGHPQIQLHSNSGRSLIAALFNANGQMFSLAHSVLSSGRRSISFESLNTPNPCMFEWTSSSPHLVSFLDAAETHLEPISSLERPGLTSINIITGNAIGKAIVSVNVRCGSPAFQRMHKRSITKSKKSGLSFDSDAKLTVVVIPSPFTFEHYVFGSGSIGLSVPEFTGSQRHPYQTLSTLRLSPGGHYRLFPSQIAQLDATKMRLSTLSNGGEVLQSRHCNATSQLKSSDEYLSVQIGCKNQCVELLASRGIINNNRVSYLLTLSGEEAIKVASIPIEISSGPYSASLTHHTKTLAGGSSVFEVVSVRDVVGSLVLLPLNARILGLSSHPTVVKIGTLRHGSDEKGDIQNPLASTLFGSIVFMGFRSGCAGIQLWLIFPTSNGEGNYSIGDQHSLPMSTSACVDSAVLPAESPVIVTPGATIHAIVDPDRQSGPSISLNFAFNLKPESALLEAAAISGCDSERIFMTPADQIWGSSCFAQTERKFIEPGCALSLLAQKGKPSSVFSRCSERRALKMATIEALLSTKINVEFSKVLNYILESGSNLKVTSTSLANFEEDVNWRAEGKPCPHYKSSILVYVNVIIPKDVLHHLALTHQSNSATILHALWSSLADSTSLRAQQSLQVLQHLDWSYGLRLQGADKEAEWFTNDKVLTITSQGLISANSIGVGSIYYKMESISGSLTVEIKDFDVVCVHSTKQKGKSTSSFRWPKSICISKQMQSATTTDSTIFQSALPISLNYLTTIAFIPLAGVQKIVNFPLIFQNLKITCVPKERWISNLFEIRSNVVVLSNAIQEEVPSAALHQRFTNMTTSEPKTSVTADAYSTLGCQFLPRFDRFSDLTDMPDRIVLGIELQSSRLEIKRWSASLSFPLFSPILLDDLHSPHFRSVDSLPMKFKVQIDTLPTPIYHKVLVLNRHVSYPLFIPVWSGGRPVTVRIDDSVSSLFTASSLENRIHVDWLEASKWQNSKIENSATDELEQSWWSLLSYILQFSNQNSPRSRSKRALSSSRRIPFTSKLPPLTFISLEVKSNHPDVADTQLVVPILFAEVSGIKDKTSKIYKISNVTDDISIVKELPLDNLMTYVTDDYSDHHILSLLKIKYAIKFLVGGLVILVLIIGGTVVYNNMNPTIRTRLIPATVTDFTPCRRSFENQDPQQQHSLRSSHLEVSSVTRREPEGLSSHQFSGPTQSKHFRLGDTALFDYAIGGYSNQTPTPRNRNLWTDGLRNRNQD